MNSRRLSLLGLAAGMLMILILAWWGWQQGGLALLQLGMSLC